MPSSRHWFISDTHFCAHRPEHIDAFEGLCKDIQPGDTLLLLGDIFEIWVSDDITDASNQRVEACLKACVSRGIDVFFMHGNRDFLVGKQFIERTGASLIKDPYIWTLPNGQNAILTHGDWFCTDDRRYRRYRRVVRNRIFQALFACLPKTTKLNIARKIRNASIKAHARGGNQSYDANETLIQRYFDIFSPVNLIIMGHTHLPNLHTYQETGSAENSASEKHRVVLGDWGETLWYGVASDNQAFELYEAPLSLDQPKRRFKL